MKLLLSLRTPSLECRSQAALAAAHPDINDSIKITLLLENGPVTDEARQECILALSCKKEVEKVCSLLSQGTISQKNRESGLEIGARYKCVELVRLFLDNDPISDQARSEAYQTAGMNTEIALMILKSGTVSN